MSRTDAALVIRWKMEGQNPSALMIFGCNVYEFLGLAEISCGLFHCWLSCEILIILKVCVSKFPRSH